MAIALVVSGVIASLEGRPAAAALPSDDRAVVHALNRLGFGPTPALVARVKAVGLSRYIDEQIRPEQLADAGMWERLAPLHTLDLSNRELADRYFIPALLERRERQRQAAASSPDGSTAQSAEATPDASPDTSIDVRPRRGQEPRPERRPASIVLAELSEQRILRAVYSEKQLQEVLVDFWFNHFNVFAGKGPIRQFVTEYERDVIRPHVLGSFRDLLGVTAKSSAMLFYLDNWMSADPDMTPAEVDQLARARPRGVGRARGDIKAPKGAAPRRRSNGRAGATDEAADARARAKRENMPRGLNENYARELLELHTLGVDGGYTQSDVVDVARAFTGWTLAEPRRGGGFRFERLMHDAGAKAVMGHTIAAGGGIVDGERVLDLLARHPSTARFIATKLVRRLVADDPPAALVDRAAARFRETDGDLREVVRAIVTSPEFFADEYVGAKVKTPFEFVVSALRATSASVTRAGGLARDLRDLGMPLYFAQPPTGYKDTAEAWVSAGALVGRMNVALALVSNQERGISVDAGSVSPTDIVAGDMSAATRRTLERASEPDKVVALLLGSPEFQRR
jgi:uncharacterized protein (DUF1800 family)